MATRGKPGAEKEPEPDSRVEELYKVPLREFTAARDALARQLRAEGRTAAAAEVKARSRPSVAAWAANQVVRQAPREWSRLRDAAAALRQLHERPSSVDQLKALAQEQREALRQCESQAAAQLLQNGHGAGPDVVQKVSGTLLALAHTQSGAVPGRLTHELPAPGFEVLAGLTLAPPLPAREAAGGTAPEPPPVRARPPTSAARSDETTLRSTASPARSAAKRRLEIETRRRAEQALDEARRRAATARQALSAARGRLADAEERCRRLEQEWAAARAARDEEQRRVAAAEVEQASSSSALEAAEAALRGR